MKIDWMLTILAIGAVLVAWSFWHAHRRPGFDFNAFDLIMENGRVSRLALWFMIAGAVSTWVVVDQQIKGTLTEGTFGLWLTAWVGPIIAKLVFNKTDPPALPEPASTSTTDVKPTEAAPS